MKKITSTLLILISINVFSQNVGINSTGASPNSSAGLDVDFTSKGVLIPRLALTITTSAVPVTSPSISLIVYNTASVSDVTPGFYYWDGAKWVRLINTGNSTGADWLLAGNTLTGTLPASPNEWIGTVNGADWIIKTNNIERMRVASTGLVGINVSPSGAYLRISSSNSSYDGMYAFHTSASTTSAFNAVQGNVNNAAYTQATGYLAYHNTSNRTFSVYGNGGDLAGMFSGKVGVNSVSTDITSYDLEVRNNTGANPANVFLRQTTSNTVLNSVLGNLDFGDNYNAAPQARIQVFRDAASSSSTDLPTAFTFWNMADGANTLTERMRITNNGNVGIGTSAPGFKLDVTGTGRFTSDLRADTKVAFNSDPTNYYIGGGIANGYVAKTWDEIRYQFVGGGTDISMKNGRIGIGTITPAMMLDAIGSSTNVGDAVIRGASTGNAAVYGVQGTITSTTNTAAGVFGLASGTSGQINGVLGQTYSTTGNSSGVRGYAGGASGATYGVWGENFSNSTDATGVYGICSAATGNVNGVWGSVSSTTAGATGVYGYASGGSGTYGLYAINTGANGNGLRGTCNVGATANGVWGQSTTGYSGYFNGPGLGVDIIGNLNVTGTVSKGGGSFKIDHPLDPENKYLYHSFVESPDMMNVYNGNITTDNNGEEIVRLPSYFEAENMDFKYQLTVIGQFAQAIVLKEVSENQFVIKTDKPNVKVSWQVTGVRNDKWAQQYRIPNEVEKAGEEKGKYLYPELYGAGRDKSIEIVKHPQTDDKPTVAR